jgi:PAS domain-containing protein
MDKINQLYYKLNQILIKNDDKYHCINEYFEYINLSSIEVFLFDYQNNPIFCNQIFRFMLNITKSLKIKIDKFYAVRINEECINGAHYYADLILLFLENQYKAFD